MSTHRCLRRDRIAGLQGSQDLFVLAYCLGPGLRTFRMTAHGGRDRIVAAIEEFADKATQYGVTSGLRDQHVELPVRFNGRLARCCKSAHPLD